MSRGHGGTERFILSYLAEDNEPAVPSLGFSGRELAAAMTGTAVPSRAAVSSAGRAMTRLADDGLVQLAVPSIRRRGANTFALPMRAD